MPYRAAALLVAFLGTFLPARAESTAAQWKYDNPFCQVIAFVAPLPAVVASLASIASTSRYALQLYTATGTTLAAHVTLVSDTDAYDASFPEGPLSGPAGDRRSEGIVVTLPAADRIGYFFVDAYVLDHGAGATCPSYVFPVGEPITDRAAGVRSIEAQHLQKIGPLTCGQAYIEPGMSGDLSSPIGRYGGKPLAVTARAYVDSNGYSIKEEIVQSSGVDGVDKYMLGAVGAHQFAPAKFLCVPVVGVIEVEMKYFP